MTQISLIFLVGLDDPLGYYSTDISYHLTKQIIGYPFGQRSVGYGIWFGIPCGELAERVTHISPTSTNLRLWKIVISLKAKSDVLFFDVI